MDPTFPLVPIANFLGCILALIPLINRLSRPWDTGICMFGIWVVCATLSEGINTSIFQGNDNNLAPIWCDISTHLGICTLVGVPACSLVITRRLYNIVSSNEKNKPRKRLELCLELILCVGLPLFIAGIYYIFQAARFLIFEDAGCSPAIDGSWLALILTEIWHILFPSISLFFYYPRIIRNFLRFKRQEPHSTEIRSSDGSFALSDFYRFFALGSFDILYTLPLGILNIVLTILATGASNIQFYSGWDAIHSFWGPVSIPESEWKDSGVWNVFVTYLDYWEGPIYCVTFFAIFGFTWDIKNVYSRLFRKIIRLPPEVKAEESDMVFGSAAIDPGSTTSAGVEITGVNSSNGNTHSVYSTRSHEMI